MNSESSQRKSPRPTTKPLKPRKFRSSCDACSASKVKCSQEQPQCTRCNSLGIYCNYSPSRRMGKPPASSRKLKDISHPISETGRSSPPAKKRQLSPPSFIKELQVPQTILPTTKHDHCNYDTTMMETQDFLTINWQEDMFNASAFETRVTTDVQLTAENLFDLDFDFMGAQTSPFANQAQFIFGDENSLGSSPSRVPMFDFGPAQNPLPSPHSTKESSPCSSRAVPAPKLCTHNLESARASLPSAHTTSSASIDQILINNKSAGENAYALLRCSCSDNPHFVLTLAMMCIKILAMYEEVTKATPICESPSGSRRSSSEDRTSTRQIPITAGAYTMDAEDEERIRVQIVVNELRKVKGLVDTYAGKYYQAPKGDTTEGIYPALEMFLRSKLTSTLQDPSARLEY